MSQDPRIIYPPPAIEASPYAGRYGGVIPPPTTGWAWVNQGPATVTSITVDGNNIESLEVIDTLFNIRARVRALPATPWTIRMAVHVIGGTVRTCGICLRESGSGELYRFGPPLSGSGVGGVSLFHNASPTGGSLSLLVSNTAPTPGGEQWLEINDDGALLTFSTVSPSGEVTELAQFSRTAHMAGGADQFGFFVMGQNFQTRCELLSMVVS